MEPTIEHEEYLNLEDRMNKDDRFYLVQLAAGALFETDNLLRCSLLEEISKIGLFRDPHTNLLGVCEWYHPTKKYEIEECSTQDLCLFLVLNDGTGPKRAYLGPIPKEQIPNEGALKHRTVRIFGENP